MLQDRVKVGCISWTYPGWDLAFYPKGLKPADYLKFYSSVFNVVEIDSTFYRIPSVKTIKQWTEKVPEGFTFTVKLSKKISHSAKDADTTKPYAYFQSIVKNFGSKLGCVVAQMPPSFKFETGLEKLERLISNIDPSIRLAVELRHKSWFNDQAYAILRKHRVCLAWAVNDYVESDIQPIATTDFLYLRFRGEFNQFTKFDHLQADKSDVLRKWQKNLEKVMNSGGVEQAFVLLSNRFEGFAPATANRFLEMSGQNQVVWGPDNMGSQNNLTRQEAQ